MCLLNLHYRLENFEFCWGDGTRWNRLSVRFRQVSKLIRSTNWSDRCKLSNLGTLKLMQWRIWQKRRSRRWKRGMFWTSTDLWSPCLRRPESYLTRFGTFCSFWSWRPVESLILYRLSQLVSVFNWTHYRISLSTRVVRNLLHGIHSVVIAADVPQNWRLKIFYYYCCWQMRPFRSLFSGMTSSQ